MKKILICISNSPHPDSFTSYGGFVTTAKKIEINTVYMQAIKREHATHRTIFTHPLD